jgi:hypothetical protein
LADALLRWSGSGEFIEIQLFQFLFGQARTEFAAQLAPGFELFPQALIGIKLVNSALREALFWRQIVMRAHAATLCTTKKGRRVRARGLHDKTGKPLKRLGPRVKATWSSRGGRSGGWGQWFHGAPNIELFHDVEHTPEWLRIKGFLGGPPLAQKLRE